MPGTPTERPESRDLRGSGSPRSSRNMSRARRGRRRLAIIDGDRLAALGEVHEHEAAAAEIARPRQRHGQGEADRHGRIDGVAAALEDRDADARRLRLLGGDHAVRSGDRQEARRIRQDGLAALRHAGRRALRMRERRRGRDRR